MAASVPNYPDILGYLTGGPRLNISVVQVALAVRPRVVRAGRAFEIILLVQNASDCKVDLTTTLRLPEVDAKKQPGRFITKHERLAVTIKPAEVGYMVVPVSSMPDTAVSDAYKVEVEVGVKPLSKPSRIRPAAGEGKVDLKYLPDEAVAKINELKPLSFSVSKRLIGSVIEAPFSVMPGKLGQIIDFKPGWVSLWTLADHLDDRLLLQRYGSLLTERVLPFMRREHLFEPLLQATQEHFKEAGYPLQMVEARFITKLLTALLEMAAPKDNVIDQLVDDVYNVTLTLKKLNAGDNKAITLPNWCRGLLHLIARDERAASQPAQVISRFLYYDLLRDAITHAFRMVEVVTGEDVGSEAEMQEYGERLVQAMQDGKALDFTYAYMPLVMGGIIFYDRIVAPNEDLSELLVEMQHVLHGRWSERNPDNEQVFALTEQLINRGLQKYGY